MLHTLIQNLIIIIQSMILFVQSMITNPYAANQKVYGQPSALMAISYPLLNGNNWYMPDIDYAQNFLNDNTNDVRIDYHIPFKVSDYLSGIISLGGKYHEFDRVTSGMSEYYDMHWNGTGRSRGSLFGLFLADIILPHMIWRLMSIKDLPHEILHSTVILLPHSLKVYTNYLLWL